MAVVAIVLAFVFPPLGIVFGHVARRQIRNRGGRGDGLALAALILGYVFTIAVIALCAAFFATADCVRDAGSVSCNSDFGS